MNCFGYQPSGFVRQGGGRGRIRTSVARKERQIYSLLVLATHPPVRTEKTTTQKELAPKHTNPSNLLCREPVRRNPQFCKTQSQLAEGFEPPTL